MSEITNSNFGLEGFTNCKVSVIIKYLNDKKELLLTLDSINRTNYRNLEVIILTNNNEPEDIINDYDFGIKIVYEGNIPEIDGEIVIIQDSKIFHIGDIISYTVFTLRKNDLLSFTCYELKSGNIIIDERNIKQITANNKRLPSFSYILALNQTDFNNYNLDEIIKNTELNTKIPESNNYNPFCAYQSTIYTNVNYGSSKLTNPPMIIDKISKEYEHHASIPKNLFVYWDGSPMSYLQYLTLKSFQDLNPEWKIILFMPKIRYHKITWKSDEQKNRYQGTDYFYLIPKKLNIKIIKIDFEKIGFRNDIPEVIKSDFLRYYLLGNFGGLWVDMDVLFIKPLEEILNLNYNVLGQKENINTVLCYITCGLLPYISGIYPIGFFMSSPNNPFFHNLANSCIKYLDLEKYQSIGCQMVKKLYPMPENIKQSYPHLNIKLFSETSYLPIFWQKEIDKIFYTNAPYKFKPETFGIHWFNGSDVAKNFISQMELGNTPQNGSIYKYLQKYLDDMIELKKYDDILDIIDNKKSEQILKISIVMAYHNRLSQLLHTLDSISKTEYKNYEIIIVNDASPDKEQLENINMDIKLLNISTQEKGNRINPTTVFNKGLKAATGDIVIIQNPESYHVGDILSYLIKNLKRDDYIVFSAYNIKNPQCNDIFYKMDKNLAKLNNFPANAGPLTWYQHPIYRNLKYHFCSAIYKDKLDLVHGFDEIYSTGYCFDDDDFVLQIEQILKLNLISLAPDNNPFVVNLYHSKSSSLNMRDPRINSIWLQNKAYFENKSKILTSNFRYPRILHTFCTEKICQNKYLSLLSFHKHHPYWKINCYISKYFNDNQTESDSNKYQELQKSSYINFIEIDNILELDNITENKRIDYLRYYLLYRHGGFWYESDIIFLKNIENIFSNSENYLIFDEFIIANSENIIFKNQMNKIKQNLEDIKILDKNKYLVDYDNFDQNIKNETIGIICPNKQDITNHPKIAEYIY